MQQFLRVLGAFAIFMVLFYVTLFIIDLVVPPCRSEAIELKGPFRSFGPGFAYVAAAPSLDESADSNDEQTSSTYQVCENSRELGPAHSLHADIAAGGKGRFSHWKAMGFVFSASDNTDPNKNKRHYSVELGAK